MYIVGADSIVQVQHALKHNCGLAHVYCAETKFGIGLFVSKDISVGK